MDIKALPLTPNKHQAAALLAAPGNVMTALMLCKM